MRALFLTLVLANAAFLAWARWVDGRDQTVASPDAAPATASTPRLALVGEMGSVAPSARSTDTGAESGIAAQPAATAASLEGSELADMLSGCVSIGPFRSLNEAASAAATLRSDGFEPRQRIEAGEVWVGYWVSWRGAATRDQAEATAAMLADRGITDTYILPAGEASNVLSLGVFTDRRRAERRREEVGMLGLDADITDRRQPGSVYWIDVDRIGDSAPLNLVAIQGGAGRILRVETRPCPATPAEDTSAMANPQTDGEPAQSGDR